jgi:hypothetical protein
VIQPPSSPARNATTAATSAGAPRRPSGDIAARRGSASGGVTLRRRSVSVGPGDTVFTVIPCGPSSWAAIAVYCSIAALLAE